MWWVLFKELEEKRDRQDGDKLELVEARHQLGAEYKEQLAPLEQLRRDHAELAVRHELFSAEHASAVERSRLCDQDMLDKARIEVKTLDSVDTGEPSPREKEDV